MSTALAERPSTVPATLVTAEQIDLIKRTVATGATPPELQLYLYDCQRQGVHPLDRLLHFTKRGGKYTPVTSIDLMRIRAAETGEYAGSDDASFTPFATDGIKEPESAAVTVWRLVQGTRYPFTATARWSEYFPGEQSGHMWRKMPHTMLAKCAEALALRKGFPRQLAGLYAKEELDQAGPIDLGPGPDSVIVEASAAPVAAADSASGAAAAPAGAKLIQRVGPGRSGAAFELTLTTGETYLSWKAPLRGLAEQLCQNHTPVFLDLKQSASGNWRVEGLMTVPKNYEPPAREPGDESPAF